MTLLFFWFFAYAATTLLLIFGIQRLRVGNEAQKAISIDELTVVVPFRNEAANLELFLNCIRSQRYQPAQWIFINDHSEDNFVSAFEKVKEFPIRVLNLPTDQEGKKAALRFGMDYVKTKFTVTMDADVVFGKEYIKSMLVLPEADMLILPVEMTSNKWWQEFFTLEYRFTHILNKGISGWFRPINASGANLLVNQAVYDEVNDFSQHDQIASGDDIFALKAFRENFKTISVIEMEEVCVETMCPATFSEIIEQRQRWLSKTNKVNDKLATGVGIWMVLLHVLYLFFSSSALLYTDWGMLFIYIGFKSFFDFCVLNIDLKKLSGKYLLGLLLFELFYPIYAIYLLFSLFFNDPEWKGRTA